MDLLLSRYRNLTVLVLVIVGQLLLLAYQVKTSQDVRLIRIWAVTGITFVAEGIEVVRRNTIGFVEDYLVLLNVREKNQQLTSEMSKLKLENQYLRTELSTADRVRALALFQQRSPSQTVAARILGTGTGSNSSVIFVDRGSSSGVQRGMAVITPDGIVGKVLNSYPTAAQVMLVTDPSFAAGVVSQKNHIHGTLKGGQGYGKCFVDSVQNEEKVEVGEVFYTSGDDRIFPKGLPVGPAAVVRPGKTFKEIYVTPNSIQNGLEEVLIVLEGVHKEIPEAADKLAASQEIHMQTPPQSEANDEEAVNAAKTGSLLTDADRLRERYKKIGDMQNHTFGKGAPGSKPPDFTLDPDAKKTPAVSVAAVPSTPAPPGAATVGKPPAATNPAPPTAVKPVTVATVGQSMPTQAAVPAKPASVVIDPVTGLPVPPKPVVRKPRIDPVTGLEIPGSAAPPALKSQIAPVTGQPIAPKQAPPRKPAVDPVTGAVLTPRPTTSAPAGGAVAPPKPQQVRQIPNPVVSAVPEQSAPKKQPAEAKPKTATPNPQTPLRPAVPLSNDRVQ